MLKWTGTCRRTLLIHDPFYDQDWGQDRGQEQDQAKSSQLKQRTEIKNGKKPNLESNLS